MRKILLFSLIVCCLLGLDARAAKGPVMLNVDVPPGIWKGVRLKNLPKGAIVALEIKSDGEIEVLLIDSAGYRRLPKTSRPLFQGRVDKKFSFSVTIPATGDYYVVFDNGAGRETREITVTIGAARGEKDQLNAANTILRRFEKQLHKLFIFESFPVAIEQCDHARAFDSQGGIVLCAEYVQQLYSRSGDVKQARNALSFSVFHELARILLAQWRHPQASDISSADELAAVMMIMLGQTETLTAHAQAIAEGRRPSTDPAKVLQDERHPLSVPRARKIIAWLADPSFARRWQPLLVPHMQTRLLQSLQRRPTAWTDLPRVEKELQRRSLEQAAGHPGGFGFQVSG